MPTAGGGQLHGRKSQQFSPAGVAFDQQPVARKRLAADDVAQLEGEALERRQARRLGVEVPEFKPPAGRLTAAMLADNAIEPTLHATRQGEVSAIDRQHERIVEDGPIEPVRHDEIDSIGVAVTVSALGPFVDPGEAVHSTLVDLAQRRCDRCRLQTVESRLQAVIVARAGAAAGEGEDLARPRRHEARGAQSGVAGLDDLAGGPDQHVGIPDGRHAVLGHRFDTNGDVLHPEVDRRDAVGLGEAEEGVGHEILRIPRREIAGQSPKEFELFPFGSRRASQRHGSAARRGWRPAEHLLGDAWPAARSLCQGRM